MLNRQKTIMCILKQAGGMASRLLLTKWAFLLAQETPSRGGSTFYQFVPYHYGPYSFSRAHEMSALVRDGLIQEPNDKIWKLTRAGLQVDPVLPAAIERDSADLMERYGATSLEERLDSIYARYPWFTIKQQKRTEPRAGQTCSHAGHPYTWA